MWKPYKKASDGLTWECDKCDARFSQKATLSIHSRTHTGKKGYVCNGCNSTFLVSGSLEFHLRTHPDCQSKYIGYTKISYLSLGSKKRQHKCNLCFRRFPKRDEVVSHLKKYHRIYNPTVRSRNMSFLMIRNSKPENGVSQDTPVPDEDDVNVTFAPASPDDEDDARDNENSNGSEMDVSSGKGQQGFSYRSDPNIANIANMMRMPGYGQYQAQAMAYAMNNQKMPSKMRPAGLGPGSMGKMGQTNMGHMGPVRMRHPGPTGMRPMGQAGMRQPGPASMVRPGPPKTRYPAPANMGRPGPASSKQNQVRHPHLPVQSNNDTELPEREWEKIHCKPERRLSESQETFARFMDKMNSAIESNSNGMAVKTGGPPAVSKEEKGEGKEDENGDGNKNKDAKILEEITANTAKFFSLESTKQFANMMNWSMDQASAAMAGMQQKAAASMQQKAAASGEQSSWNESSVDLDSAFWKKWTMESMKTLEDNNPRKKRRKNTPSKVANGEPYTIVTKKGTLLYKCHICSASFEEEDNLTEHMKRHEGTMTKFLKCSHCPKVFKSNYKLKMHERIHSDYRPYHCEICGKGFYNRANITVHMRSHTGERPYKCDLCDKAYSVKISLAAHSGSHEENKFACDKCKFCFSKEEDLDKHQLIHASQKIHECHLCKKTFLKAYLLEFHLQRGCQDERFICEECGKEFSCLDYLRTHQRVHTGEKPFGCEICGKFFSQTANLSTHMRIHNNIRPFKCDFCDLTFTEKASMQSHRRVHTKEKPHKCTFCDMAFANSSALVIHVRGHTGEKPFACDMCDKRFNSSGKLKSHYRTHTGEKPYKCTICDKAFALSNGLVRHTRMHTGERPHKCDNCGQRFMRKDRMTKHIATCQGKPEEGDSETPTMSNGRFPYPTGGIGDRGYIGGRPSPYRSYPPNAFIGAENHYNVTNVYADTYGGDSNSYDTSSYENDGNSFGGGSNPYEHVPISFGDEINQDGERASSYGDGSYSYTDGSNPQGNEAYGSEGESNSNGNEANSYEGEASTHGNGASQQGGGSEGVMQLDAGIWT